MLSEYSVSGDDGATKYNKARRTLENDAPSIYASAVSHIALSRIHHPMSSGLAFVAQVRATRIEAYSGW